MPQLPMPCCCQRCQETVGMVQSRPHTEVPEPDCYQRQPKRQPTRHDEHGQPLQELFED